MYIYKVLSLNFETHTININIPFPPSQSCAFSSEKVIKNVK